MPRHAPHRIPAKGGFKLARISPAPKKPVSDEEETELRRRLDKLALRRRYPAPRPASA